MDFLKEYKLIIAIALGVTCMVGFFPLEVASPIVIFFMGLLIGTSIIFLNPDKENLNFLLTLFIVAFLLRILVSLCLYNLVFLHKGAGLLGDGWAYSENGYEILKMWKAGIKDVSVITKNILKISNSGTLGSHDFYSARIYSFTGKSPLSLVFINSTVGSLIILFIYAIARQLSNRKVAMFAAILTAFWPSTFLWSIQNFKEPIVVFLICFLIWVIFNSKRKFRFYLVFLGIFLMLALKEFREFALAVSLFSLAISLVVTSSLKKEIRLFLVLIGCIVVFLSLQRLKLFLPKIFIDESPLEWLDRMRSYRAYGNLAFLANWDITQFSIFIIFVPIALMAAWLAPFPWQVGSIRQIIAIPEMIFFYLSIPCMIYGIRYILKNKFKEATFIIIYIFIMSSVLALIDGNIGTLFRHRAMVLPFCFILISIGLEGYRFKITAHS